MIRNANALVRLRKRQFEQAERAVAALNAEIADIKKEISAWREQMRKIALPEKGEGRLLGQVVAERSAVRAAMAVCEERLASARQRLEEAKERLKEAHRALEQAKSIESRALEALAKKRARRERAMLDEIAAGRFWRDHVAFKDEW
jgi:flagellar biosynthesis chaperone FliJ